MKRPLLTIILLTLVGALGSGAWLLGTEQGSQQLLRWVLGEKLRIGTFRGSLLAGVDLEALEYRDEQQHLTIQTLHLDWKPAALISGLLHIQRLQAGGVHYTAIGPSETTESTAPPSLPLALRLDQLELDDIRIQQGDDIQSISRVTLGAGTQDATIEITHFQINYDTYQAEGEGHLELTGHYPLQMTIRWQGELPEIGAASGAGQIGGDLNRLSIEHATKTPFRISTQGHIDLSGASPVVDINGEWQPLAWPPQAAVVQSAGGHYRLRGPLEGLHLSSEAQLLFPDTETPPVNTRLDTRLSTSRLDDLSLSVREISDRSEPLELQIRGAVSFDTDEPQLDLSGEWSHARWPLLSDPTSESPAGTFRLKGPAQQPRLESQASLTFPHADVPDIQAHLQGLVSAGGLSDITLDSELLNGKIRTTGDLTWAPAIDWNLVIQGESLDPSTQWPEWPGKLALQAALLGGISEQGLWLAADLQQLSGTLQQQPISATGRGRYDPTGLNLETLQLQSGPNRLDLHGMLGDRLDLQYALKAPDLAAFWPALQGNIEADGRLGGVRDNPEISARLKGGGLRYAGQRIDQLAADLIWAKGEAKGELTAKGLQSGDWQGRKLSLAISGTPEAHKAQLSLAASDLQLTTAVQGGWSAPLWSGQLERLNIEHAQLGTWRTEGPAAVLVGGDQFSLEATCLVQQSARLCANGAWTPTSNRLDASLTAIPLARLLPWLPEEIRVEGSFDGKLQLAGPIEALTGEAQLTLPRGSLLLEATEEQPLRLALQDGMLNLQMTPQGNQAAFKLMAGEGSITAQARTAAFSAKGPVAVNGTLKADIPDLQPLGLLLPGLSDIRGNLAAEANVAGDLQQPEIDGFIRLDQGAANVPQLGLALENIALSARNQGKEKLTLEGQLTSGGGTLRLQGDLQLDAEQAWPLALKLQGKDVQVVRLPEAVAYASPDMNITLRKQQLGIEGELKLPRADIELHELPKSAVSVSEDEVIVGKTESQPPSPPLAINAQVAVQVGEQVRFSGFGLETRLQGDVAVNSREGRTLAQGQLVLREGRYRAYGQNLTIEQGRLIFNGSPQNPTLDIKATRLSKDQSVTAILNLSGNLRAPQVEVSSDPTLPEEEALAYLVTGQSLDTEGPGGATMLRQAVAAKGLEKSQEILDRLATGLGVDEVRLEEGGSLEETALLLGKYLSPDLYVSYAVGLFDNRGALITRYRLSEKLRLEVQSGSSQSMDLIYDVER
ncbi:translocation/assembly module TamB domain-containing protein [Sedimenticola selenatireducens]|uniref:translocation/assembly module TamB domain-containing protein n=1 Tax=Sedimenticola selenatireducens TaxID=191960 RepID=UPI00048CAB00|nr:translocation/assembly module TamB domain-containing protein [Sedimenticola selenatireducens]